MINLQIWHSVLPATTIFLIYKSEYMSRILLSIICLAKKSLKIILCSNETPILKGQMLIAKKLEIIQ